MSIGPFYPWHKLTLDARQGQSFGDAVIEAKDRLLANEETKIVEFEHSGIRVILRRPDAVNL